MILYLEFSLLKLQANIDLSINSLANFYYYVDWVFGLSNV